MGIKTIEKLETLNFYVSSQLFSLRKPSLNAAIPAQPLTMIIDQIVKSVDFWFLHNTYHNSQNAVDIFIENVKEIHLIAQNDQEGMVATGELEKSVQVFAKNIIASSASFIELNPLKQYSKEFYLQTFADWIAAKQYPLNFLELYDWEINELIPYLTYLRIEDSIGDDEAIADWLSKAVRMTHLHLEALDISGTALRSLANPWQLQHLVIARCPKFSSALPDDLSALETLTLGHNNIFSSGLPRGMTSLRVLNISVCPFFKSPLPYDLDSIKEVKLEGLGNFYFTTICKQLDSLKVTTSSSSQLYALLRFLIEIHEEDAKKGIELAATSGFTEAEFLMYKKLDLHSPYLVFAVIELIRKITVEKLELLIDRDDISFVKDLLSKKEILNALRMYHLFTLVSEEVYPLLNAFLNSILVPYSPLTCNQMYMNIRQTPNLDQVLRMAEDSTLPHDFMKLPLLSYLQFAEMGHETILENISFISKLIGMEELLRLLPPSSTTVQVLAIPQVFPDDQFKYFDFRAYLKDLTENGLTVFFNRSEKMLAAMHQFTCVQAYVKALIRSDQGKQTIEMKPKKFLNIPEIRDLILEAHSPLLEENLYLYPVEANVTKGKLYLTCIQNMTSMHPDHVFNALGDLRHISKIKVRYYGSPACDRGGPGRHFFATFMQALAAKSALFAFEIADDGKLIFAPRSGLNESNLGSYRTLGFLLGMACRAEYPIGDLFSDKFYHCLRSFKSADLTDALFTVQNFLSRMDHPALIDFMHGSAKTSPCWDAVEKVLIPENDQAVIVQAADLNAIWFDDDLAESISAGDITEIQKQVRRIWLEDYHGYFQIVHAIASSMRTKLPWMIGDRRLKRWDDLDTVTDRDLALQIQGQRSVEWIKDNCFVTPEEHPKVNLLLQWLDSWIDAHADDEAALINFVTTITGAPTFGGDIEFYLTDNPDILAPIAETCTKTVFVPTGIEEESFRLTLDSWGRGENLGFNKL